MKPLDLLTIPLSWCYALGVGVRHLLYDEHILPSHSVDIPTICVGNLAVGGTGKTPHVEYLLQLLSRRYRVAVLSRGYKRATHGFVLADETSTARTIGDEAMQIHSKFPSIPVAVCEDRVRGVRQLQKQIAGLQVVVLDDAYQHRAIRCGYYVLLTPYDQLYIDDHLLPWGRLRDLKVQSQKANMVIVTKCPDNMQPIDQRVISNRLHLATFQQVFFSHVRYGEISAQGRPLVVTGIAQNTYLMEHICSLYPKAELMEFADHHNFRPADIQRIEERAKAFDFVLTTEKDYQRFRLTSLPEHLGNRLQVIPIEVDWQDEADDFNHAILEYMRGALRKQQ